MMIANDDYDYILFPVAIIIWMLYSFFDEDDKEHRRRNGDYYELNTHKKNRRYYDPYYGYGYDIYNTYYDNSYYNRSSMNNNSLYANQEYKKIVKRCKRTRKISIDNGTDKNESDK